MHEFDKMLIRGVFGPFDGGREIKLVGNQLEHSLASQLYLDI